ncbi:UDP-glycosyltransferase 73C6-like [Carica papaya]|uniref:UDP-glycosyltransferase 73C6-like n=1 Tax=Carica papaya TaxID=3649 RepID=UPI000B8C90EE|nr:UDP-glycosyltransferase 73C6-like [Carica papaya]
MDSHDNQNQKKLHFVLFPFMAQGHMIPMIDIARVLAERGDLITIITTPVNAARVEPVITRAVQAHGLHIRLVQLKFPCSEVGLPEGLENFDMLDSFDLDLSLKFFEAANMLEDQVQRLFDEEQISLRPSCLISDFCLPYTKNIASKFKIPRISFHGFSCFSLLCLERLYSSKILDTVTSDSEYFVLPNLPDKVEFTKAQLPVLSKDTWKEMHKKMGDADKDSYGVVINTFEEMEAEYIREYRKVGGGRKAWCIGPLWLCNKTGLDKIQRGKKAAMDEHQFLNWLDCQEPSSVIYACLGSISNAPPAQMIELGLALEASNRPFIWVIRNWKRLNELEKWIIEDGFEERIKGRGLLIKGWAPQVLILSHPAIAGFLTHCGWNSTIEGITAGLPLVTWPLFGDQFLNEKLAVQILKIGISVGAKEPFMWGEEDRTGVVVKKEDIKNGIEKVMDEGEEGEERRLRAKEFAEMAKKAVEGGGSSYLNVTKFIQDIMQYGQN